MIFLSERQRHVKAMMKAIDIARTSYFLGGKASLTDGLRVIRRFEKVNSIKFDPSNSAHLSAISGNGHNENFFRKARKVLS